MLTTSESLWGLLDLLRTTDKWEHNPWVGRGDRFAGRPLDGREMNGLTADRTKQEAKGDALASPGTLNIADLDMLNSVGSRCALIAEIDKELRCHPRGLHWRGAPFYYSKDSMWLNVIAKAHAGGVVLHSSYLPQWLGCAAVAYR